MRQLQACPGPGPLAGWLAGAVATLAFAAEPAVTADGGRLAAGRAALRQGDFTKAIALHEEELAARRERLGARHPDVAQVLHNLAVIELDCGRLADAQTHADEALEIREAALSKDHPDVGTTLNNLGAIEYFRGDFTAAERHLRRAVEIRRAALGKDHAAVAE